MSEKVQPPAGKPEDKKPDTPTGSTQQGADDLAKELKEHQSSASNEPAFGWMAAASPTAKSNEKPAVPAEKAAKPAEKAEEKVGQPKPEALQKAPLAAQKDVPTETTMLAIRPPEEEVGRRAAEREQAAKVRPLAPRIWQVLVAVFFPIVLLTLAIRAIATPAFLWIEYNRPGFPVDTFGFGVEDRVTFGSYAVDYLNNFTAPRFLGDLVGGDGTTKLFQPGEVSHMADVKGVYQISMLIGLVLLVLMIIGMFYLSRRSVGGVRRALFAGSIATLVIIIGIAVFALLGWERFFTDFHELFFANGTWTFQLSDTLIRLFPEQFWTDSAAVIGVLVLLAASLTFAFSWPTRRRRELAAKAGRPSQGRRAAA